MVLQLRCMKEQERTTTECMQNLKLSNKKLPKEKKLTVGARGLVRRRMRTEFGFVRTRQAEDLKRE